MNDEKNVVRLDVVRVERGVMKPCRCLDPHYELDLETRLVYCKDCGAVVDPFDALRNLARSYDRINRTMDRLREEAKALEEYKPRLRVIKEIERKYSGTSSSLVPSCPHCGEYFDLKDLLNVSWRSRILYERMQAAAHKEVST